MEKASSGGSEPPVSGSVQAKTEWLWSRFVVEWTSHLSGAGHSLNGLFQLGASLNLRWASLVVQVEKNSPAMQETWV